MEKTDIKILNKLFDRKIIQNYTNNSKIIIITSKEVNQLIKHPLIQTTLNGDKVDEMIENYNDDNPYKHHFTSCSLITIAHQIVGDKQDYYLIDGQHRLQMAFDIYDTKGDEKSFLVAIINVK